MSSDKIFESIEFATKAHSGQFRKGTQVPYIIHPLNVARILIEYECADEVIMAAILHDVVEDTPITLDDIKQNFGVQVTKLVAALSEPDKSDSWENRKLHTINHLKNAPIEVLLIACADKLDNIRAIREDLAKQGEAAWSRFNRPKTKQKWYYQSLANVFVNRIESEISQSLFTEFQAEVIAVFGKV